MKIPDSILTAYSAYKKILGLFTDFFLLAIRVIWGYQFYIAGKSKLEDVPSIAKYFGEDLHIPFPLLNAYMASITECFGGLLLLLGLFSRLISAPLAFTMLVAYYTADFEALSTIITLKPNMFYKAEPFSYLFTCLVVLFFGPGKFSLDHLFLKFFKKDEK